MNHKNRKKPEPWRMAVGILAIGWIVYMWIKKDIVSIYTTMPAEQVVPLIATTVLVSLLKIAALTGVILLIKWLLEKFKTK